ncbi:MAG: MGMT family protein [Candidatus Aenigmarchaeota archaeon]|nr:MGMT family protein [Candidatus Aenigmarchaeota archaeon]
MKNLSSRVYRSLMRVPRGKVTTYKALAESVGMKNGQRAIGRIMNRNPDPIKVPCHRVVRSDRSVGGYAYGTEKKIKLLSREGVSIKNGKIENWNKIIFRF